MDDGSRLGSLMSAAYPAERVWGVRPKERAGDRREGQKERNLQKEDSNDGVDEAGGPAGQEEAVGYDRWGLQLKPNPKLRVSL
jgi:hypothetical protein